MGGDGRGRGTAQRKERRPPRLALGAGEGVCSPLRVGNGRPPQHGYIQRELGQIVHWVLRNPQTPGGSLVCVWGGERTLLLRHLEMVQSTTRTMALAVAVALQMGLLHSQASRRHNWRPQGPSSCPVSPWLSEESGPSQWSALLGGGPGNRGSDVT